MKPIKLFITFFSFMTLLVACATVSQNAPLVESLKSTDDAILLNRGREIYLTSCTKCHAAEPIRKYSATAWEKILPDMADKSGLDRAETIAVDAYIDEVISTIPSQR